MNRRIFFYGLYMDATLLESMGYHPRPLGAARLDNHQIWIGERATLAPEHGAAAYGILIDLPHREAVALYARPEVRGYEPQAVVATLLDDSSPQPAHAYVLPIEKAGMETNRAYADELAALVYKLGLPTAYAQEIGNFAQGRNPGTL
ncbi:MAG: gamma-glutamylcyclotransferase [Xanthomonadales bacterium]|nr:gamma-glutamylcyclotransferase [Xanthomonadales bacterium]